LVQSFMNDTVSNDLGRVLAAKWAAVADTMSPPHMSSIVTWIPREALHRWR